jgi:hypothetical protein
MMKLADPQKWKKLSSAPDNTTKPPVDKLTTTPAVTTSKPKPETKQVLFKDMEFSKPSLQPPKVVKPIQGPSREELERQQSLMKGDDDFVDLPMNEQTGVDLNSASKKYGY